MLDDLMEMMKTVLNDEYGIPAKGWHQALHILDTAVTTEEERDRVNKLMEEVTQTEDRMYRF